MSASHVQYTHTYKHKTWKQHIFYGVAKHNISELLREILEEKKTSFLKMTLTAWENCGRTLPKLEEDFQELHVLAVDDSFVDRRLIERLLKVSSCRVTVVESGKSALRYLGLDGEDNGSPRFNSLNVNLIMTDYSMPGMTGYELLKKIKKSSALREIPVVVMSSENILTRIDSCLEEGAEEFLLKPVKLSDVKRLKEFILRGQVEEDDETLSSSPPSSPDYDPFSYPSPCSLSPLKRHKMHRFDS